MNRNHTGISNRETPQEEARERQEHPPRVDQADGPPPQDAAGREGDEVRGDVPERHTARKAGAQSIGQKEDRARYPDRSMPPTRKKAGAFGQEPQDQAADRRDRGGRDEE